MFKFKKTNLRLIIKIELLILAICFVIGLIYIANSNPSLKNAVVLATTHVPETFTELYFENHTSLPQSITKGNKYNFVFTVHNVEYKDFEYSFVIYTQRDTKKTIVDQGNFKLKNDESKSIKEVFGPIVNQRTKVVVELTNKNQQIDFWMGANS